MREWIPAAFVTLLWLAGCTSPSDEGPTADKGSPSDRAAPVEFELLNKTTAWPSNPTETGHAHPFVMPANVTNATLYYNRYAT